MPRIKDYWKPHSKLYVRRRATRDRYELSLLSLLFTTAYRKTRRRKVDERETCRVRAVQDPLQYKEVHPKGVLCGRGGDYIQFEGEGVGEIPRKGLSKKTKSCFLSY